jgi:uncharacterized OB-fold protein
MSVQRPAPRLDSVNRAFWTAGAEGELRFNPCQDCRTFIHPPSPICPRCLSENVKAEKVAGTGVIDTFSVNYQPWMPGVEVPYVVARVAIDGAAGVYLTTNIVGCPVDDVDIDDRVQVIFEQQGEIYFPLFEKII